jgi:anti-sigma B factor antagonist
MRCLLAVVCVEGGMQAYECEWHGLELGSCIKSAFKSMRTTGVPVTRVAIPSSSNLKISIGQVEKDTIVRLTGRVDVDSSPDLRDHLRTLLSEKALPQTVIVDLAGVSYIETSGVATLIEALRVARHRQTNFRLQGLSGATLRLFEVTGVLALFDAGNSGQKVS